MLKPLALLCGLFLAASASAQPVPNAPDLSEPWTRPATTGWVGSGLGAATSGFGLTTNATLMHDSHIGTVRIASANRDFLDIDFCFSYCAEDPDGGVSDLALLYGRPLLATKSAFASLGTGLAVVEDLTNRNDARYLVGLPFEAQLGVRTRFVGLHVYGFANLNAARSFAGFGLGTTIGLHN